MNGSKWQGAAPISGTSSRPKRSFGYYIACLALYALVMAGVRLYAHHIGVVGGLLTIVGILGAVHWYERRQGKAEILPKEDIDDRGH